MNSPNTGPIRARSWRPLEYDLAPRQLARFPRDIRLREGSKVRLHELRSPHRELLKAFFAGCSSEAIRYRFLSSIKGPSDSLLDYLADADGSHHFALIVTQGQGDDEKIVAESRYVVLKDRPYVAEFALLVLDEMQRRGLATLLIHELMDIACGWGVSRFSAEVLADNRAILSLLRKIGHPLSSTVSQGVIHLEFPIVCREGKVSEAA
jgi:GNAT superfamily N-acetyltransferase